jgi:hypothetical protein
MVLGSWVRSLVSPAALQVKFVVFELDPREWKSRQKVRDWPGDLKEHFDCIP